MVARWAEPDPGRRGRPPPADLILRTATIEDCPAIAALEHARGDIDADAGEARCRRQVGDPEVALIVAAVDRRVVGFGRAGRFMPAADAPPDIMPAGWYLFGVIVEDAWRRHGIGRALTEARLAWIRERADAAWYFTNARNRVSIDLHAALGFVEVTRAFSTPGVAFEGGEGVLCRLAWGSDGTLG